MEACGNKEASSKSLGAFLRRGSYRDNGGSFRFAPRVVSSRRRRRLWGYRSGSPGAAVKCWEWSRPPPPPDGQGAILPTRSSRTQALRHFFIACPGLLIRVCECPRDPSCVVEGFLAFTYLTKHARVAPATQCETAKLVSSFFFVYCLRELARHWQFLFPFVYSSLFLWNHVAICSCSLAQVWYQES